MSQQLFSLEKGMEITDENGGVGINILFGSAVPGGTTDTDTAPQGSCYNRTNGEFHIKT